MKKVWVLEMFESREKIEEKLFEVTEALNAAESEEQRELCEDMVDFYHKTLKNNPDGYYYGIEGKINYRDFCYLAKDAIRRHPKRKFRVVEGEIKDDAEYWVGYRITKVNEGVYRYLMATR